MYRLVLLGAPGAGKGTVASALSAKLGIPHISTGDMLRREISRGSELGKSIAEIINNGNFVSDEIVAELVFRRLQEDDCKKGYILDGFPRDANQAVLFEEHLIETKSPLGCVALLNVAESVIVKRLEGRRVCPECGSLYNVNFNPPKVEDKCDECGHKLVRRDDDRPEVVKDRLKTYHKLTEPLIKYYEEKGRLYRIENAENFDETLKLLIDCMSSSSN